MHNKEAPRKVAPWCTASFNQNQLQKESTRRNMDRWSEFDLIDLLAAPFESAEFGVCKTERK